MFFKTLYLSIFLIISQVLIANDCSFDCWNTSQKVDVHNNIQSTSKIQGTPIIYYNAGNNIELLKGFSISTGTTFSATIKPCNP